MNHSNASALELANALGKAAGLLRRGRMSDYHISIFYSEEDGRYIARIPDLKTCSAFGRTPEGAPAGG
jgi:hypothetical protein